MFMKNGYDKCGYILKPNILRRGVEVVNQSFCLNVTIISAYQLNYSNQDTECSPRIELIMKEFNQDIIFKTIIISNNSLNPYWNQKFKMYVKYPELTFLVFQIINSSSGGKGFIGWQSIPLDCIRYGYRNVPLRDEYFNTME